MEPPKPPNASYFQIFLRLRPSNPQYSTTETRFITTAPGHENVYVTPPERSRSRQVERYAFTKIFDESSLQLDVFHDTVVPLLQDAVRGRDGMLATLGVTGSGKTHTILGNKHQRGMTQLALDVLFSNLAGKMVDYSQVDITTTDHSDAAAVMDARTFTSRMTSAMEYSGTKRSSLSAISTPKVPDVSTVLLDADAKCRHAVILSMYELYNDRIFDLLDETPFINPSARRKALIFKKPSTQSTCDTAKEQKKVVPGLRKVYCQNLSEALQVLEHGQVCRKASPTSSNLVSSRSHAFLQIEIKRFSPRGTERDSSQLQIVDLAGSERARTAQTAGDRLVEAGSINRSLMCLGQCLQLQSSGSPEHRKSAGAPWRSSKLTEVLFSNTFSGLSKQRAHMIVTADAQGDFNATHQILRYSALAKEVTVPKAPSVARSLSSCSVASAQSTDEFAPGETSKDTLINRLVTQLEEAEERWRDAEDRCLMIEQAVREEVAEELDARLEEVRREAMEARIREGEWRDEFVDEKIEILRRGLVGLDVYEDTEPDAAERLRDLENENERLRNELASARREAMAAAASPIKLRPAKVRVIRNARPLAGIENTPS